MSEEQRLDPKVIPLQRTAGGIAAAVLALATLAAVVSAYIDTPSLLTLAGFGGLWALGNGAFAWHTQRWPPIDYRHVSYRVDDHGIEIRRGVFWRKVINVPRSRVQHTDVSQGPLERRYGLGTLIVYTAGTDHAKVMLAGLDHAVAMRIREHLMPERGSDAV